MTEDNICTFMGLAVRARQTFSGEYACEKAIKSDKAFLIIVARDASKNTKKKFFNSCNYYGVPYRELADKERLGHYCGKTARAVVAILGKGFADRLVEMIDSINENHGGA